MMIELKALVEQAPAVIQKKFNRQFLPQNTQILTPDDVSDCLYILESGIVEVYKESYSGSVVSVNTFYEHSYFGEIELFCPELKPYYVRTKTDCHVIVIKRDDVFEWMRADFNFTYFFCELFARRLYMTSDSMSRMALLSLKERVLGYIHAQYQAGTLSSFTKEKLVAEVRAPLRSFNRVVQECIEVGIISYHSKAFTVEDADKLEQFALKYEI